MALFPAEFMSVRHDPADYPHRTVDCVPAELWLQVLEFGGLWAAVRMARVNRLLYSLVGDEYLSQAPQRLPACCYSACWEGLGLVHPTLPNYSGCLVEVGWGAKVCADARDVLREAEYAMGLCFLRPQLPRAVEGVMDVLPLLAPHLSSAQRRHLRSAARFTAETFIPLMCMAHGYCQDRNDYGSIPTPTITHVAAMLLVGYLNPTPGASPTDNTEIATEALLTGAVAAAESFPGGAAERQSRRAEAEGVRSVVQAVAARGAQLVALQHSVSVEYRHRSPQRVQEERDRQDEQEQEEIQLYEAEEYEQSRGGAEQSTIMNQQADAQYEEDLRAECAALGPAHCPQYAPDVEAPGYWRQQHRVPTHLRTRHDLPCPRPACDLGRRCQYAHTPAEMNQDFEAWQQGVWMAEAMGRVSLRQELDRAYTRLSEEFRAACPRAFCWFCHWLRQQQQNALRVPL